MNNTIPKNALTVTRAAFTKRLAALLLLLFTHITLHAQFTVTATPTNATCTAPGSLSLAVQNAAPGIPVNYAVYLLPNAATAVYTGTGTTVPNVQPGNYMINATQVVGGTTNTASILTQITSPVAPLAFTLTRQSGLCGGGKITVNVTSGTPATYEIISGPITRPPQAQPLFENLQSGVYQVLVTDICGITATGSTIMYPATHFSTGHGSVVDGPLPSCDQVTLKHYVTASGITPIPYPLTLRFRVQLPIGGEQIFEQQVATGHPTNLEVFQNLPIFEGVPVTYFFEVIYACGVGRPGPERSDVYTVAAMNVTASFGDAGCGNKFLKIIVAGGASPYTVEFLNTPVGFDPAAFNPNFPNPFNEHIINFGNATMPAPTGLYGVKITDSCGNTISRSLSLTPVSEPVDEVFNNDCVNQLGRVKITIPELILAGAVITEAPADYTQQLPYVVTQFINSQGVLEVDALPVGNYIFMLTDTCGNTYRDVVQILPFVSSLMEGETRPDCQAGKGTIHMFAQNPPISKVVIMQAPAGFAQPLPYDVSFNINTDGSFYIDNLPPGDYYIRGYDTCSAELGRPFNITVAAYTNTERAVEVTPQCGSFNLLVKYTANDDHYATLWLQKEISPGIWGHPGTGIAYPEGTAPTAANSFPITANIDVTGITWLGHFRVLKYAETFGNGIRVKPCTDVLDDFYQGGSLEISQIKIVSCPGPVADIEVITNGVDPVIYRITHKDGSPYIINNNLDPIFTNLDPAIYTFEVTDACNGLATKDFDIQAVPPLVVANFPGNMMVCDKDNDGIEIFELSLQNTGILGLQDADEYTIQYFLTQEEADLDWHPLPQAYSTAPTTIYARVVKNSNTGCHATVSFTVGLYNTPVLQMAERYAFCENSDITITADAGYVQYQWSGPASAAAQSITISEPGQYTITVTDANGCQGFKTIEVVASPTPHISHIDKTDWTNNNNTITVHVEPSPTPQEFEYSLDGVNYQTSNTFTNLKPGRHFVFVRDVFRCGIDYREVYLLAAPPFFSPNGDGVNDTWRIDYAITEPGMEAFIFDRYGRLLYSFDANSKGWDGSFNGLPLPASDYWYVIKRSTGQEYRGHFSLMR